MTTIAQKLNIIKNAVTAIKNSIIAKGQTPSGDITTFATAIDNITTGGDSSVGVPRELINGTLQVPAVDNFVLELPSSVINIGNLCFYSAYYNCTKLTQINLEYIQEVTGTSAFNSAFNGNSNLTRVSFPALRIISGFQAFRTAFTSCNNITSINFSALTTVSGNYAFYNAFSDSANLKEVNFPALTTISGSYAFSYAFNAYNGIQKLLFPVLTAITGDYALANAVNKSLTQVDFSSLSNIQASKIFYQFFSGSSLVINFPALTSNSFGSYTDQFNLMLSYASRCTVHFPSNLQSVIGSWSDVTRGFGGTNTTILFDLPATE